jgi:hypothetical protein
LHFAKSNYDRTLESEAVKLHKEAVPDGSLFLMRLNFPNRRYFSLTSIGILVLTIAVFGWGLQYKLSLYHQSGSHSTSIAQAKLLTQKERPAAFNRSGPVDPVDLDHRVLASDPPFFAAALLLSTFVTVFLWFRVDAVRGHSSQQRLAASDFFAFRPPPSFLPLS